MTTAQNLQLNYPSQVATMWTDLPTSHNSFVRNPSTITWERLETLRLHRLGLSNKYSRHFNVLRKPAMDDEYEQQGVKLAFGDPISTQGLVPTQRMPQSGAHTRKGTGASRSNSMAPFSTVAKPTCGYFFTRDTDNRKRRFGIPASNLVMWRNFVAHNDTQ